MRKCTLQCTYTEKCKKNPKNRKNQKSKSPKNKKKGKTESLKICLLKKIGLKLSFKDRDRCAAFNLKCKRVPDRGAG